jgi:type II secretory ATPase GspE/PulE/Tfp pilus assembly ATPase PilB-like protein
MAQKEGMVTLEQDGLLKAAQGLTSLEEVYKLVK